MEVIAPPTPSEKEHNAATTVLTLLQAGRGVAALSVVIFHADLYSGLQLFSLAYLGVDFFFVLSGFIIFWTTEGGKLPRKFLVARLRRVFVPYLPIAIVVAVIASVAPWLKGDGEWSWLTTLTLLPFGPDSALGVAWTLRHELVFYVLFALTLFSRYRWLLPVAWPLAIAVAYYFSIDDQFILGVINLEFVFGMLSAAAVKRSNLRTLWFIVFGIVCMTLAFVTISDDSVGRVVFGLAVSALLVPLVRGEMYQGWRAPDGMRAIGNASYSIYLVHNPIVTIAAKTGSETGFVLALLAGTGAGFLYYKLIEEPALKAIKGQWSRSVQW